MNRIDVGVFAHNEGAKIGALLASMLNQTLWRSGELDAELVILANGCTDDTVAVCRDFIARNGLDNWRVEDLADGGKSRTWNRFVHDMSRRDCDALCFVDADIWIEDPAVIERQLALLNSDHRLKAINSRPVKDIALAPESPGGLSKLIARSAGGLDDWKHSICGQLYLARADAVRKIRLPIGLPVEDGFIRAMLVTDGFRVPGDSSVINGTDDAWHVYKSERAIGALIRHQVRLVIGGAINTQLFGMINSTPVEQRDALLLEASTVEGWLGRFLAHRLPRWPYGWVPVHFLVKRVVRFAKSPKKSVRSGFITCIGFAFDSIAYAIAQVRMARGTGANYW